MNICLDIIYSEMRQVFYELPENEIPNILKGTADLQSLDEN